MTLDLPQPFGPTMPTSCPGVPIAVGSTNDLKPASLIWVRRTWTDGGGLQIRGGAAVRARLPVSCRRRKNGNYSRSARFRRSAAGRAQGAQPAASGRVRGRATAASAPSATAWQATLPPPGTGRSCGSSVRQRPLAYGQRGWNVQPGGGSSGFGTSPATAVRATPVSPRSGTAASSIRVYGCCGRSEQLARRRELDDAPEVHHADAIGDVMDHREVVRNEEVREAETPLQVAHQVQHLRLHRHVERRRRLVADEEARLARERPRDRDPLPLPARELVRIARTVGGGEARPASAARRPGSRARIARCRVRARGSARRRCRRRASAD